MSGHAQADPSDVQFYIVYNNMYKDMSIREATENDIPVIRQIAGLAFPAAYRDILTADQIDYMMQWMYSQSSLQRQFREGHVFFLAGKDGVPAGYVSVQPESGTLFHLQKLYVHPAFQAAGVGSALFLHALSYARGCGAARVELNVNRHNGALAFYRKMGMSILREVDNPIGEGFYMNDYIMEIDL